jgi:hypothetical protein
VFHDFFAFSHRFADSKKRTQARGFRNIRIPCRRDPQLCHLRSLARNDPSNVNVSEFCDRAVVDAAFDRAQALELSDPAAARKAWGKLDQKVTDLAPFIPVVIPEGVEFLSKRARQLPAQPRARDPAVPALGVVADAGCEAPSGVAVLSACAPPGTSTAAPSHGRRTR